jgi:HEAT repeat protein
MRKETRRLGLIPNLIVVLGLFAAGPPGAATACSPEQDAYTQILSYEYDQSRQAFAAIEEQLRRSTPAQAEKIAESLLQALESPRASVACREMICRTLVLTGACSAAPKLADLVTDEKIGPMALFALQALPCPEVDEVLRGKLDSSKGGFRVALINSLGERRVRLAAAQLAGIVKDSDSAVVEAALAALGRFGDERSADFLAKAQIPSSLGAAWADARLKCADSLAAAGKTSAALEIYRALNVQASPPPVAIAALRGMMRLAPEAAVAALLDSLRSGSVDVQRAAAGALAETPGKDVTSQLAAQLGRLSSSGQVLVLGALAVRKDKSAAAAVAGLASSRDDSVRLTALDTLSEIGDDEHAEVFVRAIRMGGETAERAVDCLARLRGASVDQVLLKSLADPTPAVRAALIGALAARRCSAATPSLVNLLADRDAEVRMEAWKALAVVARPDSTNQLIARMLEVQSGRELQAAEQAVFAVCSSIAPSERRTDAVAAALPGKNAPQKSSLLRVLGRLGGAEAVRLLREALEDKDAEVQDTAVRTMADWGDASTAGDLLKLARESDKPARRIVALRGYVRLAASTPVARREALGMLRTAMELAKRPEDRRMVLGSLADVPLPEALDLAERYLSEQALRAEAAAACFKIAAALVDSHPQRAKSALQKVLASSDDERLRRAAQRLLGSLE